MISTVSGAVKVLGRLRIIQLFTNYTLFLQICYGQNTHCPNNFARTTRLLISILLVVIVLDVDHNLLKGVKQQKAQLNTELGVSTTERQATQAQKAQQVHLRS